MGTEVVLKATSNIQTGTIQWLAECVDVRTNDDWEGPQIKDCYGIPGSQNYKASVGQISDAKVVNFYEPNSGATTIGNIHPTYPPAFGGPSTPFDQTMQTMLKWNGVPLGPCATLCYKEKVTVQSKDRFLRNFLFFRLQDWIPPQCVVDFYGFHSNPTLASLRWRSPNLFDENTLSWGFDEFKYIQRLQDGTVIAERQHQYQFYGSKCNGWQWGPLVHTVWLDLKVMPAQNANGQPVPIPGSNPPRFFKWPIWVVRN